MKSSDTTAEHSTLTGPFARLVAISILAALLLAPIWVAAFPPLLDYPNHLARAFVLGTSAIRRFLSAGFIAPTGACLPIWAWTRRLQS